MFDFNFIAQLRDSVKVRLKWLLAERGFCCLVFRSGKIVAVTGHQWEGSGFGSLEWDVSIRHTLSRSQLFEAAVGGYQ